MVCQDEVEYWCRDPPLWHSTTVQAQKKRLIALVETFCKSFLVWNQNDWELRGVVTLLFLGLWKYLLQCGSSRTQPSRKRKKLGVGLLFCRFVLEGKSTTGQPGYKWHPHLFQELQKYIGGIRGAWTCCSISFSFLQISSSLHPWRVVA